MFENKNIKTIPGVSAEKIDLLESIIDGKLPEDYKTYLRDFGLVSVEGRDLYGLGSAIYFNTYNKTKELQEKFNLRKDFVVIEDVGTEGMFIMLKTNGLVYEWTPTGHLKEIYKSFSDFILNDF